MRRHDLRCVVLSHDGETLWCKRCRRALTRVEAIEAWERFGEAAAGAGRGDALEAASRLERWPLRWLVRLQQNVSLFLHPPRCEA